MRIFRTIAGALLMIVGLNVLWVEPWASAAGTNFNDTFTDTNGTVVDNHTPDTGTSWTQVFNVGTCDLEINSNVVDRGTCSLSDGAGYTADATYSTADYGVHMDYPTGDSSDDYSWVGIRVESDGDGYWCEFNTTDSECYEVSSAGGTFTSITTGAGVAGGSRVILQGTGSSFAFYDDGTQVMSFTDATYSASGKAGMGMGALDDSGKDASTQEHDNFEVIEAAPTAPAEPEPPKNEDYGFVIRRRAPHAQIVGASPPVESTEFSEDFQTDLSQWTQNGNFDWEIHTPSVAVPDSDANNTTAGSSSNACLADCIIDSTDIDLSSCTSADLSFWRFVDSGVDSTEYLKVFGWRNTTWVELYSWGHNDGDDSTWHFEDDPLDGTFLNSDFKLRYEQSVSSSIEDIDIDDVTVTCS